MSSKVAPYFILTAEKVIDPKELKDLEQHHIESLCLETPATPPGSRVTGELKSEFNVINTRRFNGGKNKGFVRYKIPVKEVRRKERLNKKMELIKEKLEKSRERFIEQKQRQNDLTIKCEPTHTWFDPEKHVGTTVDHDGEQGDENVTHLNENKKADRQPYVYFVVSEDANDNAERIAKQSEKKRSALRDRNGTSKGLKTSANIFGLAREIGLKSSIELKSDSKQSEPNKASINSIVFPSANAEPPKSQFPANSKGVRSIPSPPRIPPCTPATIISGENKIDLLSQSFDPDETVPRKPFLSGPMYSGKTRAAHSSLLQHFDLPTISADQKRRALGLGTRFEEFAYPKPQSEQRQRKVSFADPLPVIRGSGFVLSSANESKDNLNVETPTLGPRAVTMGSINLPSEQSSRRNMCHKFLSGEGMTSARNVRKSCIPLPLPKIDIVSNVYDEMIIKMIQEYLQDSNTPSRQSQLARELLINLQKHNEHMKELNVPTVNKKSRSRLSKAVQQHRQRVQELISNAGSAVPPNTAEDPEPKAMTPIAKGADGLPDAPNFDEEEQNDLNKSMDNPRSIPFVQITFKSKDEEAENGELPSLKQPLNGGSAARERKGQSKPILSVVTPVSFQMAPPGLSKEDSFMSLPSMKT